MIFRITKRFEPAEQAHRKALAIRVQQEDRTGEADSLLELGSLCEDVDRPEDAVKFFRQAADIYVALQDPDGEGACRSNLAQPLIKLQRYDEARRELYRAIECRRPLGLAAELWKIWDTVCDLEKTVRNMQAATQAWQEAVHSYMAYRRAGGENQTKCAELCTLVAQFANQGEKSEAEQALALLSMADTSPWSKTIIPKLQAILRGDRNPALVADLNLHYHDAVELQLLLEALGL